MAGSKRRILVIEDDRKTADLVRLYLESDTPNRASRF